MEYITVLFSWLVSQSNKSQPAVLFYDGKSAQATSHSQPSRSNEFGLGQNMVPNVNMTLLLALNKEIKWQLSSWIRQFKQIYMLHLIEGNERFLAILFISNLDRETKSATFHGGTGPPTSSDACRIVHDETMDNPYCNHCGCGMPFSGRLVWSTQ